MNENKEELYLFRGKTTDKKSWILGDLVHCHTFKNTQLMIKDTWYHVNDDCINLIPSEVIRESIGQYTGKNDKNNIKIFDGDIIKFAEWRNGNMCWIGAVEYDYGSMYVIRGHKNEECDGNFEIQLSLIPSERIEIIGNKTDNPELFKTNRKE